MSTEPDLNSLRACIRRGAIQWQKHAGERLLLRNIKMDEVTEVVLRGLCIRNYPEDQPWPSALFFAVMNGRPLHVVAALRPDGEMSAIITAYEPTVEYFEPDFITRRKG